MPSSSVWFLVSLSREWVIVVGDYLRTIVGIHSPGSLWSRGLRPRLQGTGAIEPAGRPGGSRRAGDA